MAGEDIGIVLIGRNEGERFVACLASMPAGVPVVYVDSGSTDGSIEHARAAGVSVVELPTPPGFTAARARNAGWRALLREHPALRYIQFIDGDCTLDPSWIVAGQGALDGDAGLAVAFGRLAERYPEASLYNAQCDREWNVPVGEVRACGGVAMMRTIAIDGADGFSEDLIAGEEPDLCLRMRSEGWRIRRIDASMGQHDADIHRFGAWWKRTVRGGHAYAEHLARHGERADPDWRSQVRSVLTWALALPLVALVSLIGAVSVSPLFLLLTLGLLALYPLQVVRLTRRDLANGEPPSFAWGNAMLLVLAKFAMLVGILGFWRRRISGRSRGLIEYKR